jgi:hypothetical protein
MRYTVEKDVGRSRVGWRLSDKSFLPVAVSCQQLLIADSRRLPLKPFSNRRGIKMDEDAFTELFDCG